MTFSIRRPAASAGIVVAIVVLALAHAACGGGSGASAGDSTALENAAPDVASSRLVCRLMTGNADAGAATITGADGAQSVRVGDTAYWFFGDTVRRGPDGRQDVIQA